MSGKIIAVVGAPGCGKSFLADKLAKHYGAAVILEGEEKDFPSRIINALQKQDRNSEVFLWFRNKLIKEMFKAQKLSLKKRIVIVDTFWLCNEPYIHSFFSGVEKNVFEEMCAIDRKLLPYPDIIIYLRASKKKTKELILHRKRNFEQGDKFLKWARIVEKHHERIFSKKAFPDLIIINRDKYDFERKDHLQKIIQKIDERI